MKWKHQPDIYRLLKSDKNFGKENLGITKDI